MESLRQIVINHTPHECRHTTATLPDKYGANLATIKKILGHSAKDLTSSVYIHNVYIVCILLLQKIVKTSILLTHKIAYISHFIGY